MYYRDGKKTTNFYLSANIFCSVPIVNFLIIFHVDCCLSFLSVILFQNFVVADILNRKMWNSIEKDCSSRVHLGIGWLSQYKLYLVFPFQRFHLNKNIDLANNIHSAKLKLALVKLSLDLIILITWSWRDLKRYMYKEMKTSGYLKPVSTYEHSVNISSVADFLPWSHR